MSPNLLWGRLDHLLWSVLDRPVTWGSAWLGSFRLARALVILAWLLGAAGMVSFDIVNLLVGPLLWAGIRVYERASRGLEATDVLPIDVLRMERGISRWRKWFLVYSVQWVVIGGLDNGFKRIGDAMVVLSWLAYLTACFAVTQMAPKTKERVRVRIPLPAGAPS